MSAKQATARRSSARRAPPVDDDQAEIDREFEAATSKAPKAVGVTTRIAARNIPGRGQRGGRVARSSNDREHMGRTNNKRTSEFSEAEIQEFMRGEENQLPYIPDTDKWHYKWTRIKLAGKDDGSNIVGALNGRMQYELVKGPDQLPPGLKLMALTIKDGDYQSCYQYSDCILMRCPLRMHKLATIAGIRRAEELNRMLDSGDQAGSIPGERRTGIVVEENIERSGVREVVPDSEDEIG